MGKMVNKSTFMLTTVKKHKVWVFSKTRAAVQFFRCENIITCKHKACLYLTASSGFSRFRSWAEQNTVQAEASIQPFLESGVFLQPKAPTRQGDTLPTLCPINKLLLSNVILLIWFIIWQCKAKCNCTKSPYFHSVWGQQQVWSHSVTLQTFPLSCFPTVWYILSPSFSQLIYKYNEFSV